MKKNLFDIYIDREVVDKVNFKKKDLLCVLALMLRACESRRNRGDDVVVISSTPSALWDNVVWKVKPTHTDRKNFMESLNRLIDSGLIVIEEASSERLSWSTLAHFNITNLLHEENNPFIIFCNDTFEYFDNCNYSTLSSALQLYLSIVSYFDMSQIREFDEAIKNKEKPIEYNYDLYGKLDFHISCWASYKRLMTTKHSKDSEKERWVSDKTLTKLLSLLEEVGLIAIVRTNINGENFPNHYCYPRHKNYVEMIAKRMAEQQIYNRD